MLNVKKIRQKPPMYGLVRDGGGGGMVMVGEGVAPGVRENKRGTLLITSRSAD